MAFGIYVHIHVHCTVAFKCTKMALFNIPLDLKFDCKFLLLIKMDYTCINFNQVISFQF